MGHRLFRSAVAVTGVAATVAAFAAMPAEAAQPRRIQPVTITSSPAKVTNSQTATFAFHDPTTGSTYSCQLDRRPKAACNTGSVTYSGLTGGAGTQHTFTVTAVAKNFRGTSSKTYTWTIDTVPPAGPASATVAPKLTNHASVTLTWPAVTDTSPGGVGYLCALDAGTPVSCTSPWTTPALPLDGSKDGGHTATVWAVDAAGNRSLTSASDTWTLDSVPPVVTILNPPADPNNAPSDSIEFSVAGADSGTTVTCAVNGGAASACTSPQTVSTTTDSPPPYTFTVTATDAAGNVGTATASWTRSSTAPSAPQLSSGPAAFTNDTSPTFTWGAVAGAASYECSLDSTTSFSACTSPKTMSGVADGAHVFRVRAVDAATNRSASASWAFTVDTVRPTISLTNAPSGAVASAKAAPTVTGHDNNAGVTVSCTLAGPTPSNTCGPYAGLADGSYTLSAHATDAAGNTSTPVVVSWRVDTTPPSASTLAPTALNGPVVFRFVEPVTALNSSLGGLKLTDTGAALPVSFACLNGSTTVKCTGSFNGVAMTAHSVLVSGQHYTATLGAGAVRDLAGNPSKLATGAFRAPRALQETSAGVVKRWQTVTSSSALGGSYVRDHLAGATASWTFTGRAITWWTVTGPSQGRAYVSVDGIRRASVDNYAASTHFQVGRVVKGLANRSHRISILVRGLRGSTRGTGTFVAVDGFTVGTTRTSTPALAMSWHRSANRHFSGGFASVNNLRGAFVQLTFRGTGVTWWTQRGPAMGRAAVYVDGVLKMTVDNFARTPAYLVKRAVGSLKDAVHVLKIVVLGNHRARATGSNIVVDRLVVA